VCVRVRLYLTLKVKDANAPITQASKRLFALETSRPRDPTNPSFDLQGIVSELALVGPLCARTSDHARGNQLADPALPGLLLHTLRTLLPEIMMQIYVRISNNAVAHWLMSHSTKASPSAKQPHPAHLQGVRIPSLVLKLLSQRDWSKSPHVCDVVVRSTLSQSCRQGLAHCAANSGQSNRPAPFAKHSPQGVQEHGMVRLPDWK